MWMSFIKFAILSTVGELIGLRISTGNYYKPGFGILPRALVWSIFGMGINFAFIVFSTGVPAFITYLGVEEAASLMTGPLSWQKLGVAFAISTAMNTIFAPVFMTLHKITDTHILATGGSLKGFFTPIPMGIVTVVKFGVTIGNFVRFDCSARGLGIREFRVLRVMPDEIGVNWLDGPVPCEKVFPKTRIIEVSQDKVHWYKYRP